MAKPRYDEIEVRIKKVVEGALGLAEFDGRNFFIPRVLPNELVRAKIFSKRKGVYFGEVREVLEPSPLRIEPPCAHYGVCGGCTFQHASYDTQIELKQDIFYETLARIGKIHVEHETMVHSPRIWAYRNKMEFTFGRDDSTGEVFLGLHRRGRFDKILRCAADCLLISDDMRAICEKVEQMAQGEPVHDPISGAGFLRFFTVRKSFFENKLILGITLTENKKLDFYKFWFEELDRLFPNKISGAFITLNRGGSSTEGDLLQAFGSLEFIETIGSKRFNVSAASFFQTNPDSAEKLYTLARDFAELSGTELLWDLYCGTGTIGIFLSDYVRELLGVEQNPDAIADAIRNATLNGLQVVDAHALADGTNVSGRAAFIGGDVRKTLAELVTAGVPAPKVLVIDPPRAGLTEKIVAHIASLMPERIVYISCNPATLARDGLLFGENGYKLLRACPVDMFPQTAHIEGCAIFARLV